MPPAVLLQLRLVISLVEIVSNIQLKAHQVLYFSWSTFNSESGEVLALGWIVEMLEGIQISHSSNKVYLCTLDVHLLTHLIVFCYPIPFPHNCINRLDD